MFQHFSQTISILHMFSNVHCTFCRKSHVFFVILGTSAALGSTAIPERHLYGSGPPPRERLVEAHRTSQFDHEITLLRKTRTWGKEGRHNFNRFVKMLLTPSSQWEIMEHLPSIYNYSGTTFLRSASTHLWAASWHNFPQVRVFRSRVINKLKFPTLINRCIY